MFQVELVWNREFNFVEYEKPYKTIEEAIKSAQSIENSGDGERVKKTRIIDNIGNIVWIYGRFTTQFEENLKQ